MPSSVAELQPDFWSHPVAGQPQAYSEPCPLHTAPLVVFCRDLMEELCWSRAEQPPPELVTVSVHARTSPSTLLKMDTNLIRETAAPS